MKQNKGSDVMDKDSIPKFRTEGKPPNVTLFLQCSECEKDIRPILRTETIQVNRGYYCKECDDGAVHLNLPKKQTDNDKGE